MAIASTVLILTFIATVLQLYYWLFYFRILSLAPSYGRSSSSAGVSVIVCAHNEYDNLLKNLPQIVRQIYPLFEVVVVNHGSTDDTKDLLQELQRKYSILRVIHHPFEAAGKRPALLAGIRASRFERILLTDADCVPSSSEWLAYMVAPFAGSCEIVLGAAPFRIGSDLVSLAASFGCALTFLQYGSATLHSASYMGVGRNMAYLKGAYLKAAPAPQKYIGGDDDLLVSGHVQSTIALVYEQAALMWSEAPSGWIQYFRQKRRHLSVSWAYTWQQKLSLSFFAGSHWTHLTGCLVLGILGMELWLILLFYALRAASMVHSLRINAKPFVEKISAWKLLVSDLTYLVQYPIIALLLFLKPPEKW